MLEINDPSRNLGVQRLNHVLVVVFNIYWKLMTPAEIFDILVKLLVQLQPDNQTVRAEAEGGCKTEPLLRAAR